MTKSASHMKPSHLLGPLATLATLTTLALLSCDNPADHTTDAEVADPVAKETSEAPVNSTKYVFTENSAIGFIGSKVTGSHTGGFKAFTGHFTLQDGKPVGNDHQVVIDMTSTWSDTDKLTTHLKSADFFDVEKFPTTTFAVTSIESTGSTYNVTGNLDLHGVTKSITFPATVSQEGDLVKINAEFDINRFDFNIQFPGKTDDLIRPEVVLNFSLEAKPE